jgi:predicted Zn finger-like uncharacterized protein
MIIQCPRCSTRWRVADPSATDNPVFKCGRCHHVFPQFPGAPRAPERGSGPKARSAPPEPDTLEFIFPRRARAEDDPLAPAAVDTIAPLRDIVHDPPRAALAVTALTVTEATPLFDLGRERNDTTLAEDPPLGEDDPFGDDDLLAARGSRSDDAPRTDDAPSPPAPRVLDMEAMMSASARIQGFPPATRLLLTLVAAFALLALFAHANPARTAAWLARVPLIGGALTAEPALGSRITLSEVQGGYQHLRTGRRIFVISGKATNNALVAVERIEVEGGLYAASGAVARKVISTGNRTTLKLRDLSESEIALLQNLDARQTVAPGGSVDFAIVFLEPPRDLREFSSRVLTARSIGRASNPPDRSRRLASVG